MMISSYFQSTYNSGRVAQAYLLAAKVKAKLTEEAVKNDVDLHRLVCQANLLDNLIENLNVYETNKGCSGAVEEQATAVSYNSIDSNPYPLLNNITVDIQTIDSTGSDYSGNHNDLYYDSDDSDFDSESDNESDYSVEHENETADDYDVYSYENDLCSLALQRLNIKSSIHEISYDENSDDDNDNDNDNDNNDYDDNTLDVYGNEFSVNHTTVSFSESGSEVESESDVESDAELDAIQQDSPLDKDCSLVRMHSQHLMLDIHQYEELHASNESSELNDHSDHSEDFTNETISPDDLPSLSNCSSVSSLEECISLDEMLKLENSEEQKKHSDLHISSSYNDIVVDAYVNQIQ